ncbi:MAG TPA: porin [Croceibacterium sp.]|nr:porin [Croceibacterium sp.]
MRRLTTLILAATALVPIPALAQGIPDEVQRQLSAMQAEIARLSAEVAELKAEKAAREAPAEPTSAPNAPAVPVAASAPPASPAAVASAPATTAAWKGAPEWTAAGGWSFKPRGRLQLDAAVVDAPDGIAHDSLGVGTEIRRLFLGFDGTLPGNFGYRFEADLANSSVELTDVFLTYKPSGAVTLTVGQHKPFTGLEELTSDLFTSMLERAAFTSAFGFERRVGVSGTYSGGELLVQLGAFTDNARDLNSDSNNSYSLDGRLVFSPELGAGRLHLGASAHYRDFNDATDVARYRARPFVHTTDVRLVDTGEFSATGERHFGAELAYLQGPFHATAEGHVMTTMRPDLADPTFWGGYVEVGMLVTGGDTTAYRGGAYDRIRPSNPVSAGGIGAIQLNARYDHIDLSDGAIVGGMQDALGLSAIWMPTDYVRFLINYGHLWVTDAAVPTEQARDYQVDTMGVRAQVDF